jgi:hypothetical protein
VVKVSRNAPERRSGAPKYCHNAFRGPNYYSGRTPAALVLSVMGLMADVIGFCVKLLMLSVMADVIPLLRINDFRPGFSPPNGGSPKTQNILENFYWYRTVEQPVHKSTNHSVTLN